MSTPRAKHSECYVNNYLEKNPKPVKRINLLHTSQHEPTCTEILSWVLAGRKKQTASWIKTLQCSTTKRKEGDPVCKWVSGETSPKQMLREEGACKGIYLLYVRTGEKPPVWWLHKTSPAVGFIFTEERFQRLSSGHTTNEIVTSQLTLYNVFFHSINRLLLVLLP